MNRRAFLSLSLLPLVSRLKIPETVPTDPRGFARWAAQWDLRAHRHNWPDDWQALGQVEATQWCEAWGVIIGVGPPEWLSDRAARVLALLHGRADTLAAYRTDCGRAFAVAVDGELTTGLRQEFKRPLWRV